MAKTRKLRCGIYCRISQDRLGDELGVTRQRHDCEELAAREGWEVGHVYIDDDMSASNGKPRPNYLKMLDDLEHGRIDAVIAWHPDRLLRSPRELEDFIDLVESTKAKVRTVQSGEYDLTTPAGRMTARIVGAVARHESEHMGARISRSMVDLAQKGQYTGGTRMYGYTLEFKIVPEEAKAIRDAAKRLLAGESLTSLARDLNARGCVTTRGNEWTSNGLQKALQNPKLAALTTYKGEVLGDAPWKPILTRTQHEQIVRKFDGSPLKGKRRARTRPLAGLLRCGKCGHNMVGSSSTRKDLPARRGYRCPAMPGYEGCGNVTVAAHLLEGEVRDRVIARLAGAGLVHALRSAVGDDDRQKELSEQLRTDEATLQQLSADFYQHHVIGRREFLENRKVLTQRIEDTRKALLPSSPAGLLSELPATEEELRDAWELASPSWKRALVGAVADEIVVDKATTRGKWDPDRVRVSWKW